METLEQCADQEPDPFLDEVELQRGKRAAEISAERQAYAATTWYAH